MSNCSEDYNNRIEILATTLCDIVLTTNDTIGAEEILKMKKYIDDLKEHDINILNSRDVQVLSYVRSLITKKALKYIESYKVDTKTKSRVARPFDFGNDNSFVDFCVECELYFKEKYKQIDYPEIINLILTYIGELIEHHRLFGSFYEVRTIFDADKIVSDVTVKADASIEKKVDERFKNKVDSAVQDSVQKEMVGVTKDVSKTNVTTLGLFTGIVFAFIGSLFYSASVLESVSSTNVWKLLSIASLVGFVCYHLITVMFRFVSGIHNDTKKPDFKLSCRDWIFTILLLLVFALGVAGQFKAWPSPDLNNQNSSTSIHALVDVKNSSDQQNNTSSAIQVNGEIDNEEQSPPTGEQ